MNVLFLEVDFLIHLLRFYVFMHKNLKSHFFMKTFSNLKSLNALWMQCDLIMNALEANEWVMTSFWRRYECNIENESNCIQNESNVSIYMTRSTRFWMQFDDIWNAVYSFDSFLNAMWRQLECIWLVLNAKWLQCEWVMTRYILLV